MSDEHTVCFEDLSVKQVAGFLEWVQKEQSDDPKGMFLEVDGENWEVSAQRYVEKDDGYGLVPTSEPRDDTGSGTEGSE